MQYVRWVTSTHYFYYLAYATEAVTPHGRGR
jgi:hypothetical protein